MPEEQEIGRRLRPKEKRQYDFDGVDDDEIDGKRTFSLEDKLNSDKYNKKLIKELKGSDVNLRYFQENGFKCPIVIKDKSGLGMRVPSENFTVNDVKQCVGSRRMLDCMDVTTQKGIEMTMKEWVKYYENTTRERLLNVISLEFSGTKLENYVEQPEIVRDMDWVDNAWPWYYKECQTEATNILDKMKYPKVQKYCLMSVAGCYTDFHIDMGGTSVWYHILKGKKVFWLIPPTEENLALYEQWTLSGKQGDQFFADKVKECQCVVLEPGWTFFIPTGWIHGVYTPKDSLVFGGNFLHLINVEMQLRVWDVETNTRVPLKFRYPFFTEMHWYVLERYVSQLTSKQHRVKSTEEMEMEAEVEAEEERYRRRYEAARGPEGSDMEEALSPGSMVDDHNYMHSPQPGSPKSCYSLPPSPPSQGGSVAGEVSNPADVKIPGRKRGDLNTDDLKELIRPVSVKLENCMLQDKGKLMTAAMLSGTRRPWVHLTPADLRGLTILVRWLRNLPAAKRFVPKDIPHPDALIRDAEVMLEEHCDDDPHLAVTGEPVIRRPIRKSTKIKMCSSFFPRKPRVPGKIRGVGSALASGVRRRRVRCRRCEPCTRPDCHECVFCKDMKKYGGPARLKQSCLARQCLAPMLPHKSVCRLCGGDEPGSGEGPSVPASPSDSSMALMECGVCWEITHPKCLRQENPDLSNEGVINEDLPNSWECPKCSKTQNKLTNPRMSKGLARSKRQDSHPGSSGASEASSDTHPGPSHSPPITPLTPDKTKPRRKRGKKGETEDSPTDKSPRLAAKTLSPVGGTQTSPSKGGAQTSPSKGGAQASPNKGGEKISPSRTAAAPNSPNRGGVQNSPVVPNRGGAQTSPIGGSTKTSPGKGSTGMGPTRGATGMNSEDGKTEKDSQISPGRGKRALKTGDGARGGRRKGEAEDGENVRRRKLKETDSPGKRVKSDKVSSSTQRRKTNVDPQGPQQKVPRTRAPQQDTLNSDDRRTTSGRQTGDHGDNQRYLGNQRAESTEDLGGVEENGSGQQAIGRAEVSGKNRVKKVATDASGLTEVGFSGSGCGDVGGAYSGSGLDELPPTSSFNKPQVDPLLPTDLKQELHHKFVVRPAPIPPPPKHLALNNDTVHVLDKDQWTKIFHHLSQSDLATCMQVCKTWYRWSGASVLWSTIDLCRRRIKQCHLLGIVRRQPAKLDLSWTNISRRQLEWLVARLPHLQGLALSGNSWPAVSALCSSSCPLLRGLDLSWVAGIYDHCIEDLVSPPRDRRPGVNDLVSRLDRVVSLSLAGSDITGVSLSLITHFLPHLKELDLSYCNPISDDDLANLSAPASRLPSTLTSLNLTGCSRLTDASLETMLGFTQLRRLVVQACPHISVKACQRFIHKMWEKHRCRLQQLEEKWLVQP